MNKKIIFLLIGQKGSGKSYVGTLMESELGIKFIRVEDWAKTVKKGRDVADEDYLQQVFDVIEEGIRASLMEWDTLVFESTGLTTYFDRMLRHLKRDFYVVTIRISAPGQVCLDRVRTRDQSIHIAISDDQVEMINQKVRERNLETDFMIDNERKSERELIDALSIIVQSTQATHT